MKDYLLLFRGGLDFKTASAEQLQNSMSKWRAWMDGLATDGKLAGGERLIQDGKVVNKEKQVSDGPFIEAKEIVAGYLVVKSADLDEAAELSKGCPIFDFEGFVEVREIARM